MPRSCWRRRRRTRRIRRSAICSCRPNWSPGRQAIYARAVRARPREPPLDDAHDGGAGQHVGEPSYETDRMRFIGRQPDARLPGRSGGQTPLSNSEGSVLDPIVSIRQRCCCSPTSRCGSTSSPAWPSRACGVEGADREVSRSQPGRPRLRSGLDAQPYPAAAARRLRSRCAGLWPPGRLDHLRLGAAPGQGQHPRRNRRGQSGLWGYGISGDLPIVLVRIRDHERMRWCARPCRRTRTGV
jgi:cyclic beta-1,2-glucan synthetase